MPKSQIRILGIDDAPFKNCHGKGKALVLGTVFRGGDRMDGLLSTYVKIDGLDSTRVLIPWICESRNKAQLSVVMLDGISLGGFNIVDIQELSKQTSLPVIVVIRHEPDYKKIYVATYWTKPTLEILDKNSVKTNKLPDFIHDEILPTIRCYKKNPLHPSKLGGATLPESYWLLQLIDYLDVKKMLK